MAVFFITSLTLTYLSSHKAADTSVVKMPVKTVVKPAATDAAISVDKAKVVEPKPKDVPQ